MSENGEPGFNLIGTRRDLLRDGRQLLFPRTLHASNARFLLVNNDFGTVGPLHDVVDFIIGRLEMFFMDCGVETRYLHLGGFNMLAFWMKDKRKEARRVLQIFFRIHAVEHVAKGGMVYLEAAVVVVAVPVVFAVPIVLAAVTLLGNPSLVCSSRTNLSTSCSGVQVQEEVMLETTRPHLTRISRGSLA